MEISDLELRLIVGEFFNTRFNVLKSLVRPISNAYIYDPEKYDILIKDIKAITDMASEQIGARVESVVLVLPSNGFKRINLKINVPLNAGVVRYEDVKQVIKLATRSNREPDKILVDTVINRYTVNGISYRKIPLNEVGREMSADVDLLMIDKDLAYDYVSLVERAGIKVMDISLDTYDILKEALLLEKSVDQNVIVIKADALTTTFALLSKGRLVNCDCLNEGIYALMDTLYERYKLSKEVLLKLIDYDLPANPDKVNDDPVYVYEKEGIRHIITNRDLYELLSAQLNEYVDKLVDACSPILANENTSVVMVGESCKCSAFVEKMTRNIERSVKVYEPNTMGAKDPSLVAVLGSFYVYEDNAKIKDKEESSIDLMQFEELMSKNALDTEMESLTSKIKGLFSQLKR